MFRRLCFAAIAAAALITALPIPPAQAEQVLKLAYALSTSSQFGAGANIFKRVLEKRTSGRYRIEVYPASALGDDAAIIKGVQAGQIDIAFVAGPWFAGLIPELGILDIPFLFRDANHARAVLDGPIGKDYLALFAAKGMVALAFGEDGMRHITNARHPIRDLRDLAGLKLLMPSPEADLLGLGTSTATPLAIPALRDALESGTLDGEATAITTVLGAKLYEVQKYLTLSAHAYGWAVFIMSKDAYAELSDEDKAHFAVAAHIGGEKSRQFASDTEREGIAALRKEGMEVVSDFDREAFVPEPPREAAAKFVETFGPFAAAQIERIRNAK